MRIVETYRSKSNPGQPPYTTQVDPTTGLVSCDCKGWTSKREGKPRFCTHCKDLVAKHDLTVVERDGQMFVSAQATAVVSAPPAAPSQPTVFVEPMLASKMPDGKTADSFSPSAYVMEEKFDGHRLIVKVTDGKVRAWSRDAKTRTLPTHIAQDAERLPNGVYDGEIIIPGGHSYDVTAGSNAGDQVLVLWDMLEVLGDSVMDKTLVERRAFLEVAYGVIEDSSAVKLTVWQTPSVKAVEKIWKRGGEGAIIKRRDARYQPGYRSADWIKVKSVAAATVTITGFEAGKVGPYSAVAVVDAQGIETSVKTLNNATMRQIAANPASFVGRKLVISYQERTPSGKYRHPMWDHMAGAGE